MAVDFNGKWEMYDQSDPEEFLKAMAVPDMIAKRMRDVKPVTTIKQDGGQFVITVKTPFRSNSNSFTIGQETEFCTMNGQKCTATAQMVDGKIVIETERLTHVREIQGEDMVETLIAGSATLIRRSKRV